MKSLTAKQEGFAVAVAKGSTKADAYRQNYKTDGWNAEAVAREAEKVSRVPAIARRIVEMTAIKQEVAAEEFDMTVRKLLLTFMQIAFTDPNELISMRSGACRHCWGMGGAYQWKEREFNEALGTWQREHDRWSNTGKGEEPACPDPAGGFGYRFTADANPECVECEGEGLQRYVPKDSTKLSPGALHLYRGVQYTKEGPKILFADKDGALDKIGRILGAYDDRLRVDLKGAVANLHLTTSDPQEAARAYETMLTGAS